MGPNEAETCRKYVLPKLQEWDTQPHFLTVNQLPLLNVWRA